MFSKLVANDRTSSQMGAELNERPVINVAIRRSHIYEDAFEKISPNNGKCAMNTKNFMFT